MTMTAELPVAEKLPPLPLDDIAYPEIPAVLLDPQRRHDCLFLFDVENGNPNGDPDAENAPRIESVHGYGIVTDGCLKAKMRRAFREYGNLPLFIQPDEPLNNLIRDAVLAAGGRPAEVDLGDATIDGVDELLAHAADLDDFVVDGRRLIYTGAEAKAAGIRRALTAGLDSDSAAAKAVQALNVHVKLEGSRKDKKTGITAKNRADAETAMVQKYIDVRLFGAVMSTGLNAGQRRGPVQVVPASSTAPIFPQEMAITRQAKTTEERHQKSRNEMGRRSMLTYGLYQGHLFYNASLGIQSGVTSDDLKLLWESMMRMFALDHAAGRGMMRMRGLYVWSHSNRYGWAPYNTLFEMVKVQPVGEGPARCFDDHRITVRDLEPNDRITFTRLIG